jgi:hypothetical protein
VGSPTGGSISRRAAALAAFLAQIAKLISTTGFAETRHVKMPLNEVQAVLDLRC